MTDNIIDTYMPDIFAGKSWYIFPKYVNIVTEYLSNFSQSSKYKKPASDNQYLLVNGLNTIVHVFKIILQQTFDPVLALGNMQKAIYYYTPFIEQMEENILHDLNISSNSASIFVYKKTIGVIEVKEVNEVKETIDIINKRDILNNIEQLILIHREIVDLLILNNSPMNEIIEKSEDVLKELCGSTEYLDETVFQKKLTNIKLFIKEIARDQLLDINVKYELIHLYIKNYNKEPEHILSVDSLCKKKAHPEYYERLSKKYIRWLWGQDPTPPNG